MKAYRGTRKEDGCVAFVIEDGEAKELPPRTDLMNHSPDGFEWGYEGSGPAQLALAILAYEFGDEEALEWYQTFKRKVIANIGKDVNSWEVTSENLRTIMKDVKRYG